MFFTTICAVNWYISGLMKRSSRGDSSNRKIMAIDKRHSFHPQFHMNYKDLYVKSRLFFLHWSPNLASKLRTQNVLCIISVDHSKSNFHANHLWCEHCQGRKLGKPPWEILVAKVIGNWLLRLHISTLSHEPWAHFLDEISWASYLVGISAGGSQHHGGITIIGMSLSLLSLTSEIFESFSAWEFFWRDPHRIEGTSVECPWWPKIGLSCHFWDTSPYWICIARIFQ